MRAYSEREPRLGLQVKSEAEFYAEQARDTTELIRSLGWPLAITVALGAVAGVYNSIELRARQIAILRALGFGMFPAFASTILESLVLSTIGATFGVFCSPSPGSEVDWLYARIELHRNCGHCREASRVAGLKRAKKALKKVLRKRRGMRSILIIITHARPRPAHGPNVQRLDYKRSPLGRRICLQRHRTEKFVLKSIQ